MKYIYVAVNGSQKNQEITVEIFLGLAEIVL